MIQLLQDRSRREWLVFFTTRQRGKLIEEHTDSTSRGWLQEKRVNRIGMADVKTVLAKTLDELGVNRQTKRPRLLRVSFPFDVDQKSANNDIEEGVIRHMTDILGKAPHTFQVRSIAPKDEYYRSVQVTCVLSPLVKKEGGYEKA